MTIVGKHYEGLLALICLLSPQLTVATTPSPTVKVHRKRPQSGSETSSSSPTASPAEAQDYADSLQPSSLPPIDFPINLSKYSCSSTGAIDAPGQPVHLPAISTSNGDKTILLAPLADGDTGKMCILSRWSDSQVKQAHGIGHYHPLGRSVASVDNGKWTRPPGRPARELNYLCGLANNTGMEFEEGEYLCQVTLPWTRVIHPDFSATSIFAPYYMTYYERSLTVRQEISRFLHKATFGPTPQDLDSLEAAHAVLVSSGLTSSKAMEQLQTEWIESQMDPSTFTSGSFSSLRKYWRQRVNARSFEVYRIGESGPAPCEENSRWRKFAFTKYDVQNARYLRWGDDGVTTQIQKPHKVTIQTVDLRAPTLPPITSPTPLPVQSPTASPVIPPTANPTITSAPTGLNILGFGDFETSQEGTTDGNVYAAWPSSCETKLLDSATDNADDVHSGSKSFSVTGGRCSVLLLIGKNCPATRVATELAAGDTIKISLWVKMAEPAQVFQMFTAHYHSRKAGRWARPKDDSHVISRTRIDNANRWKYIEAYHTIGPDWTFEGQILEPKFCKHYQVRFNLAESTASYIMDDVKIEKVSSLSDEDQQVLFLRNPSFASAHSMWKLSSRSGTIEYDDDLAQNVMQIKKGQILRQEVSASAIPGEKYSFGFWVRLLNSNRDVTLKIILRMRFQNKDRVYGPCKNPICNLYERPVQTTIAAGSDQWQHIIAEDFEMYGNYTAWDGKLDFIMFQITTQGMPNSASLRIANFHDLQANSVPPSTSLVPSFSPTTLGLEDVAYIVRYAGFVRTLVKNPFQIDATGEVLPMDESVEYELCDVEEVEGSLSELPKGLSFIIDGSCTSIRGGNPTVDLDARYLNTSGLHLLDLSDTTSIEPINVDQTYGGDLLLQTAVQDAVCDTFPSPYDNDYRGANAENPDAVPSRFDPDAPVFALLPDGSYALYDPRIILRENSLESPLIDGGGNAVLRSTLRAKNGFSATRIGSSNNYFTSNDLNIVLCANEQPNFVNRDDCILSYEENACVVEQPSIFTEEKRFTNGNVEITLTFDSDTLSKIYNATASSYREANATANVKAIDNKRYILAMSNLRYDETNTNGSYPLPCLEGNPRSRWIPREDLNASDCTNNLQASSLAALANALENSNDQNVYLRDIYLWNSVEEDGCDPADEFEYGMLVLTNEGCWENVHPDHMSVYDFTRYVVEHPVSDPTSDTSITSFADSGILQYPDNHLMSYFEELKEALWFGPSKLLTPIARFGDMMIVDEFAELVGINNDPVALSAVAELGQVTLNNDIKKNRGGGVLVCGSPNEVVPDPTLDDFFDVVHSDLNCVGCQKSYGDYFAQKQTVWTINALEAEDQFCSRMAWALYELVNVGTTTAPDNTESNLYTYDIFQRHCFGNYYDILKEMSYNPKMGEQFGFVMSTSTRFRYDRRGDFVYPDENYAREVMQLYTIGLHFLNDDGTEMRDNFGRSIQTYTNSDILSNSRIWSGFEYTARRGNVEELFRASKSRQDPMRIIIDKHDFLPKFTLGSWIGERYPLCSDLPNNSFLKIGAEYHLRGGSSIPISQSVYEAWDGDARIKRFVLSPTSSLYQKLCNADANGDCQYANTVVIDENLPCEGKECRVDSLVVVQVSPGVFYEFIRQPCVHAAFYNNAKKVVTGHELALGVGTQYSHAMCADPTTASAARTCCDNEGNKVAFYNYKLEYHGERVTAATNDQLCAADGLSVCDPSKVIADEPLVLSDPFYNHGYPSSNTFYWTDVACKQLVKIRSDGMVAIVNDPTKNSDVDNEATVPFVSLDGSVTYITMPWLQDIYTEEYLYPSSEDNSCDNGACSMLDDGSCLCPITVSERAVFDSLPNRTDILSKLKIGAFDPSMYSDSSTPYSLVDSSNDVEAYSSGEIGDASTIFKLTDEYGNIVFLKNLGMNVTIGSSYTMGSPVSFMNMAKPDELDATYEIDAFLKYLMRHQNTPAYVSKKLIQFFGVSNPTPGYVLRVTQAFKDGTFTKNGATFGDDTYGNLAAVAAAIILDPEASDVVVDEDPINGNVREPLLKVIQTLRSLSFTRNNEMKLATGLLKEMYWKIGQMVFQPPDQFSFFDTDYSPPGFFTDLEMVSPEAELLSMNSVVGITNGFFSLLNFGLSNADGGFGPFISTKRDVGDYSSSVGVLTHQINGDEISSKIDDLDTIMTAGRLSAGSKQVLTDAYNYFLKAHGVQTADKVLMALALASPEFHTSSTLNMTGSARAVTPAATKSSEPYKAIVYIYLGGGLDSFNLLTPHNEGDCGLYDNYFEARGGRAGVGLTIDELLTINGTSAGIDGCNTFGVNKLMSSYKEIYDEGKGIFLANMGHLHKPVSKTNWMTETRTDLFSHHSMKREAQYVDAFREGAGPGVLGRMCDVLESQGHAVSATSVNIQAPMVDGSPSTGRYSDAISTEGLPKLFDRRFLNGRTGQEFRQYLQDLNGYTTDNSGVMSNFWSQRFIDVWAKTDQLTATMRGVQLQTEFAQAGPDIGSINQQLKLVAQLIANRDKRGNGLNREVFFVEFGGFDTHSDQNDILGDRLPALNNAVANFWAEIKAQGLAESITVVQGSEFGRTISANSNDGTDHAWGGNYFMFGGNVDGGKILGEYPTSFDESDSTNIGRGRLIPTRSWDSLWYGITQWFGITSQEDIDYVLPNSGNFGCDLFTDEDMFTTGTNKLQGCGGPTFNAPSNMEITEPRFLTGEEQKGLCKIAVAAAANQLGINPADTRCFIADQVVTPSTGNRRLQSEDGDVQLYAVSGVAKLNFDSTVPPALANPARMEEVMTIAAKTASDRVVVGAVPRTEAPSISPSLAPSISSAPSTETAAPTRAPVAPMGLAFSSLDIGYCAYTGESYESSDGVYNVKGSGEDIWGTSDSFHMMYVETSGDADLSVFIKDFSAPHEWAKAGLMFRASLAKDSAHYSAFLTGNQGLSQQTRRYNRYLSEQSRVSHINPMNPLARFVKIQRSAYTNLNILEVQVFDQNNVNRALASEGATASQSSTYFWSGSTPCPASIAIDGSTSESSSLTCEGLAHTNTEQDPWLMIDLGASYDITSIKIWNRLNCCSDHLSGSTLSLLNEDLHVVRQIQDIGSTSNVQAIEFVKSDFTITVDLGIWLRVKKVGNTFTAFYKEAFSSFWVQFGLQLSIPSINSNGYYIGVALTSHDNSNPEMASLQATNLDLNRDCTIASITPEQCEQAANCELGLRTDSCYDAGIIKAKTVKVHLPKTEHLHLAEIQVLNEYGDNVALYKPATMSSVYDPYYYPYPADGVDGIVIDSMFHTDVEPNPWWAVDLIDVEEVKEVIIYNREHACDSSCQARANGAIVSLFDKNGRVFDTRDIGEATVSSKLTFSGIAMGSNRLTKRVKIQQTSSIALHLTEVQVFDEAGANRALGKPATMSSLYQGNFDYAPEKGVDGVLSGLNLFHTDHEFGAWFEVDLVDPIHVKQIVLINRQDLPEGWGRLSNADVTLIDTKGEVHDHKNVGDTTGVSELVLNFNTIKRSILPPKELEPPGYFEYFGGGWCRDSQQKMYDYLRYYIEGVSAQVCQDKCSLHNAALLTGISTYSSYYCYCWYENGELPSPLPSDVHAFSSSHQGVGEVSLTLNEPDGDCYKFFYNAIVTESPTFMPTNQPSTSPSKSPSRKPTKHPTASPTQQGIGGAYTFIGNSYCTDSSGNMYDYGYYLGATSDEQCDSLCPKTAYFRGFSLRTTDNACFCWYDDGYIPSGGGWTSSYSSYMGTGVATQVYPYESYSTCYGYTLNV